MSNIQYAFIDRTKIPDRTALQASIAVLGFDLKLHPEYTPFKDSGFLPFTLEGEEGPGFDIEYEDAANLVAHDNALRAVAANNNYCITMAWHGSARDLACAMIVSYVLAKDFGAVVSFEGGPAEPNESLLAGVHEALEEARAERRKSQEDRLRPNVPRIRKPWWKFW